MPAPPPASSASSADRPEPGPGFAAVLGSPIRHSLSPVLHRAAYAALGLLGWRYEAIECTEPELAETLRRYRQAAGFSVTMPLKRAALRLAGTAGELTTAIGAANTLLPGEAGWHAENTDWLGIREALAERALLPNSAVVLGAGATAQAALAALDGVAEITVLVREPARAEQLLAAAERLSRPVRLVRLADLGAGSRGPGSAAGLGTAAGLGPATGFGTAAGLGPASGRGPADLLISTLPPGAADQLVDRLPLGPGCAVLDVVYAGWPTPLARAAARAGAPVLSGASMLLHQAAWQVRLMTGRSAPVEAMRAALRAAVPGCDC